MGTGRAVRESLDECSRLRVDVLVHVVHDTPLTQGGRVVQVGGHHQFPGPAGAGPFGQPLRATHRRSEGDNRLHQPEPGLRSGDDDVARERDLECRGEREPVRREHHRARQRLDRMADAREQRLPQLASLLRRQPVEHVDVDTPGDHLPLRPQQHCPRRLRREVCDVGDDGVEHRLVEEIQWPVVQGEHGDLGATGSGDAFESGGTDTSGRLRG